MRLHIQRLSSGFIYCGLIFGGEEKNLRFVELMNGVNVCESDFKFDEFICVVLSLLRQVFQN